MGIIGIKVSMDFFRGIEYAQNSSKIWLNLDFAFSISQFLATELWRWSSFVTKMFVLFTSKSLEKIKGVVKFGKLLKCCSGLVPYSSKYSHETWLRPAFHVHLLKQSGQTVSFIL